MEAASSMDEGSTTSSTDSQSTLPLPLVNTSLIPKAAGKFSPPPLGGGSLCRMGSGTSVIIDSENGIEAESRKLPSSKYKGVVPQPNGRWGAQIYEKHQRVWLGTFNEEDEAARSYDVAAQRFRGRDAVTNFKPLSAEEEAGAAELRFLNSRSKAEIVDMLRKHTYHDELLQSRRNLKLLFQDGANGTGSMRCNTFINNKSSSGPSREQLFEKVVTPSDVGKLNRLVIPKQHAEKHFPLQGGSVMCSSGSPSSSTMMTAAAAAANSTAAAAAASSSSTKGVLLNFEDVNEKVWRFRYSYWNSSQSYVLTKGWSRFVKEKNLKAGDIVIFQRSTGPDRQLYIDWKPRTNNNEAVLGRVVNASAQQQATRSGPVLRLFGVDICRVADAAVAVAVAGNGKRLREVELLAMESSNKKQMVVAAL